MLGTLRFMERLEPSEGAATLPRCHAASAVSDRPLLFVARLKWTDGGHASPRYTIPYYGLTFAEWSLRSHNHYVTETDLSFIIYHDLCYLFDLFLNFNITAIYYYKHSSKLYEINDLQMILAISCS